jgi:hypothetical protein
MCRFCCALHPLLLLLQVPRDQPKAALQLLQDWMQAQLENYAAAEAAAAEAAVADVQQQLDRGSSSMGAVSTS